MTKSSGEHLAGEGSRPRICGWCQRPLARRDGPGRPRAYCRQGCRQQAFLARKLASAHGLADGEVIVDRAELEALQDRVAMLGQAIGDVQRDQAAGDDEFGLTERLAWLVEHAREVAALRVEPVWGRRAPLT